MTHLVPVKTMQSYYTDFTGEETEWITDLPKDTWISTVRLGYRLACVFPGRKAFPIPTPLFSKLLVFPWWDTCHRSVKCLVSCFFHETVPGGLRPSWLHH